MRDHGGDLDRAKARYGAGAWIDLSTGINRQPYPVGALDFALWTALPLASDLAALEACAARAYGAQDPGSVVALSGAQAAIQLIPRLRPPGRAAVLSPSYNEHAAALDAQGWEVSQAPDLAQMRGADLAVLVNPNNPDGRHWPPAAVAALAAEVGLLVVDESFADATPDLSLIPQLPHLGERVVILRSFGKFFGLAGARLGFALAGPQTTAQLRALAGPWAVSGPSIALGRAALADRDWQARTTERLKAEASRLTTLLHEHAGWRCVGATALFVTVETPDARAAQDQLAETHIWTRAFPYSPTWLRLGLPGTEEEWSRLAAALTPLSAARADRCP